MVALHRVLLVIVCVSCATALAADSRQLVDSPEGKSAFDDLGAFYADNSKKVPYDARLKDLAAADAAAQKRAGAYIATLFKQSYADEFNGRAPVKRSPFFGGGGTNSDARVFRAELAKAFGTQAAGDAALDSIRWLLNDEKMAANQAAGLDALKRIKTPQANELLQTLLNPPHPVATVVIGAINELAERQLKAAAPAIKSLCNSHRSAVRDAARKAAPRLGLPEAPEFKPETAFTPALITQIENITALVFTPIPKDAKWAHFTSGNDKSPTELGGWVLAENKDGTVQILDWFGNIQLQPKDAKRVARTLAEEAHALVVQRRSGQELSGLSRGGMGTFQFEPKFASVPELLVGAWSLKAGEKAAASEILFSLYDSIPDDRWLGWVARDLIGASYHQQMLVAFSHQRDMPRTLAFARHLSKPVFDDYSYQPRAKQLAEQIEPSKPAGPKKVPQLVPTPDQWAATKKKTPRIDQIKLLAQYLEQLNCIQMGQPGDVDYADKQFAEPYSLGAARKTEWINPYTELRELGLTPAEIPTLVPHLNDKTFLPTFSYWRDFHAKRTLHQLNWVVAAVINDAAKKPLVNVSIFESEDAAEKQKHTDTILAWCKENAAKTRDQLPDERPKAKVGGPRIDAP